MLWKKKKTEQLLVVKQYKLNSHNIHLHELSSRSCELWISQKNAEEKTRAWANAAMVSCVAVPHESEAKCANNKRPESIWYLSEIGLPLAAIISFLRRNTLML